MRTLYLTNLGGMRYGIWKDEVRSVREAPPVHRLPLSPACVAGISVLDGRSTALADLAVCVGLRPPDQGGKGLVLFVAGKDADSAFIVPGPLAEAEVPSDAVFPMPDYVRTAEIDTCVVLDSAPVPVINLTGLYAHIHEADPEPSVPSFTAPPGRHPIAPEENGVRLISSGGELFALLFRDLAGSPVPPGLVSPLALTPRYVRGLVFHDQSVFPVIHLSERMGLPAPGGANVMAVAGLSSARFGFLVDEDQGTPPADQVRVMPLPPVAQTGWTPAVVLYRGTIIPLLDLSAILSAAPREHPAGPLPEQYSPGSVFPEAFERQHVEVVEFSLLGVRHALPKTEVEDIVAFKPYRRVPDALPIVIGVTGHKGDVLPVLDLAMVFGRRSLETADWSMVLVKNGDFRAFVITEHVYDERMLPKDVQRKVPIILPHNLVYGCYPEGTVVRLILNVEALAVHFDKSMVKELLTALTREMAGAPAELVPSLLPEEHRPIESRKEEEEPAVAAAAEPSMMAQAEAAEARAKSEAEEQARREAEEQARRDAEERARAEAEAKVRAEAEARILHDAEERAREEAERKARLEADERARAEAETTARAESETNARREQEELARREEEARALREAEEKVRRDAEEQARRAAEERARIAAEEKARHEAEEETRRRAAEKARVEEEESARRAAEEETRRKAAAALREAEEIKRKVIKETIPASAATFSSRTASAPSGGPAPEYGKRLERGSKEWRKYIAYGIAAIVLSLLVYFGLFKTAEERGGEGKAPLTAEAGKGAETPASLKKPEREGPLVLKVPQDKMIETEVYIVKRGDTLWDICERFTGDPFNYPRVAGDNRIANPDLIFPGQKIELRR